MVAVLAINEHIISGTRRAFGEYYDTPEDTLQWLEKGCLALSSDKLASLWFNTPGRVLTPQGIRTKEKATERDLQQRLRVLQLTYYDPGNAAYRYHSALNASGAAVSAFVRFGHSNPYCDLRQWDGDKDLEHVRALLMSADVVISHMDYRPLLHGLNQLPFLRTRIIRMYHGSVSASTPVLVDNDRDAQFSAIQIGARLYHKRFSEQMHWLPIPMPVQDYGVSPLRESRTTLRVAHSPTNRAIKGTAVLEEVVAELQQQGLDVQLVLIENLSHTDAIKRKRLCHITFDSFWLGLQGSGLEASCMGQQVMAGDPEVHSEYIHNIGMCPYTYVHDRDALKHQLTLAYTDESWRRAQAKITQDYTRNYHSYHAVGARFTDICKKEGIRGTPIYT